MGSSSFLSHNIALLPCMACCRGNRPETGLAFPALPGESTHADMQLTTTCCMTGSGISSPKCQRSQQPPGAAYSYISGPYQRHHAMLMTNGANWAVCDDRKIKPDHGNVLVLLIQSLLSTSDSKSMRSELLCFSSRGHCVCLCVHLCVWMDICACM